MLLSQLGADVTFLVAILMTLVISDFFYLAARTVLFLIVMHLFTRKLDVFVLNFIDGEAHIVTNENY